MSAHRYILRCQAPDAIGILAAVAGYIAENGLNVVESHDFGDLDTGRFFIRVEFDAAPDFGPSAFRHGFARIAGGLSMEWSLRRADELPRAVLMVSKGDHCLNDLLYRHRRGRLGVEICAIISNHETTRWHAERHDAPFHYVEATSDTKTAAEEQFRALFSEYEADLVVLARYMQVLSNDLCRELSGRCINIHHSFLPSFKGARPYHQAHARGVKLIGATAHYVTADLDEGPIIAQEVAVVDHRFTPEKMVDMGRDIEARVLSRAVTAHGEGRIFMNGKRTVVFE